VLLLGSGVTYTNVFIHTGAGLSLSIENSNPGGGGVDGIEVEAYYTRGTY